MSTLIPAPPLPPVENRESPFVRLIRQLNIDNGGLIYECELETARQGVAYWEKLAAAYPSRRAEADGLLHKWEPLPFVEAQAIFTTSMHRNPELLRRRQKEFGIDGLFRRRGRMAVRYEAKE